MMGASKRWTVAWIVVVVLSVAIAGYASLFLILGDRMYPAELRESFLARPWGILPHAAFGMIALALGPLQFHPAVQARRAMHRLIGKIYVMTALGVGIAGMYMALHAYGGPANRAGFAGMATALLVSTLIALSHARSGRFRTHREWMIRSFAVMFSAVTLRIYIGPLIAALGGFDAAYAVLAWISWVPNLVLAEIYIRRSRGRVLTFGGAALPGETAVQHTMVHA